MTIINTLNSIYITGTFNEHEYIYFIEMSSFNVNQYLFDRVIVCNM